MNSGRLQAGTKVQVGQYVVQIDRFLSEGGFAHVYVASLVSPDSIQGFSPSQNRFVLKRMAVPDKPGLVQVRKEVDVMKQLRPHKHIVYFIEASASSIPGSSAYEIFILMEWCSGGGIIDLLNSRLQNRLTESEILKIFSDTVEAVAHMHSQNPILIHRDLKVENILVASSNLYKLCDFGSTTSPLPRPPQTSAEIMSLEEDLNKHTTLQYRAPEMVDVWSRKGVTEKADIWALGVFLYKLCYYTTPFEANGPLAIVNVQYQIPSYPAYSNSIKYLIGTMLQELAQSRPDIWEVHEHVSKLRGLTPHLIRPKRKPTPSNLANSSSVETSQPQPPSKIKSQNGLDSIFTPTHLSAAPQKVETVVPMRRGRPTSKSKPLDGTTVPMGNSFFESEKTTLPSTSSVTAKSHSPPEESDLFAREAAAGFGDDFLSPSPQFTSFKPTSQKPQGIIETNLTRSQAPPKPLAPKPQLQQQDSKTVASTAFDDLVPSKKTIPPKTLNEIRNNLSHVNSVPGFGTSKFSINHLSTFTTSNMRLPQPSQGLTLGDGNFVQKTGPHPYTSRLQQTTTYRAMSITQKTGPPLSSGSPAMSSQTIPTMSDWLKKDQAQLLKNSSLELIDQPKKSLLDPTYPTTDTTPSATNNNRPSIQQTLSQDRLKLDPQTNLVPTAPKSFPTSGMPPVPPVGRKPTQNYPLVKQQAPPSSDSEEEPEDPEGQKDYRVQISRKPSLKSSGQPIILKELPKEKIGPVNHLAPSGAGSNPATTDAHQTPAASNHTPGHPSPSSSSTQLSSSEAMTEEDEEVKLKRRAAIAKFAPAGEQASRDPFSSRAGSRPGSAERRFGAAGEAHERQGVPALRAPRPQSVKAAAAINNLVSRYETLSASTNEPAPAPPKKRHSVFKPLPAPDKPAPRELPNPSVHIPKIALGPALPAPLLSHNDNDDDDEKFTSVVDLKSKWESGAVLHPKERRLPRTDYGQT